MRDQVQNPANVRPEDFRFGDEVIVNNDRVLPSIHRYGEFSCEWRIPTNTEKGSPEETRFSAECANYRLIASVIDEPSGRSYWSIVASEIPGADENARQRSLQVITHLLEEIFQLKRD